MNKRTFKMNPPSVDIMRALTYEGRGFETINVSGNEIELGRLPKHLVCFFEYMMQYKEDVEEMVNAGTLDQTITLDSPENISTKMLEIASHIMEEYTGFVYNTNALIAIFWKSVRLLFPETSSFDSIGIRTGYILVGFTADEPEDEQSVPSGATDLEDPNGYPN